jgi:V/A-type H+-transporting ATPase subunit D
MAITFKYNKSALYDLSRQLKAREQALPTLKSKEAALRLEVKREKQLAVKIQEAWNQKRQNMHLFSSLWVEFETELVTLKETHYETKTIAGVKIPVLHKLDFELQDISQFHKPDWFLDGIEFLKDLIKLELEKDAALRATAILEYARKKTTQKVNLYEKVQMPEYTEAIRKVKRFLEDEENLSKAAQKILKRRNEEKA